MVGLDFNPPWTEGIRNTVRMVSHDLIEQGNEVHILTKGSDLQPKKECVEGIIYHRISVGLSDSPLSGVFKFLGRCFITIPELVKRENIEIVHSHSVYPILGIVVGISAKIAKAKSIFTLYSSVKNNQVITGFPKFINLCLKISKNNSLLKLLPAFVDCIITTSDYTYKDILDIGVSENKLRLINIGVDTSIFIPSNTCPDQITDVRSILGIPSNKKVIFFAGDMVPWKGLDIFIESMVELNKLKPDYVGLVAEKSMYECRQERATQINNLVNGRYANDILFFTGRCDKISTLYEMAEFVVYPYLSFFSLMDTPVSLLEAMALGKPIIATKTGGFPEIIEHGRSGFLIEPGDRNELVNAMLCLIENKDYSNRMGIEALNTIHDKYRKETLVFELINLYKYVSRQIK